MIEEIARVFNGIYMTLPCGSRGLFLQGVTGHCTINLETLKLQNSLGLTVDERSFICMYLALAS